MRQFPAQMLRADRRRSDVNAPSDDVTNPHANGAHTVQPSANSPDELQPVCVAIVASAIRLCGAELGGLGESRLDVHS
jgi:hypothetical protein